MIKGYCRGRPGHLLVEQGDYQMIRAEDSQTIDPTEFAKAVEPGTTLEMSIVMRQRTADQTKCPRCGHMNSQLAADRGWIEWQVPPNSYPCSHLI